MFWRCLFPRGIGPTPRRPEHSRLCGSAGCSRRTGPFTAIQRWRRGPPWPRQTGPLPHRHQHAGALTHTMAQETPSQPELKSGSAPQAGIPQLPSPTGEFGVGRVGYEWTDGSRPDGHAADSKAHRDLMVYLWYPAPKMKAGEPAEYLPGAKRMDADAAVVPAMREEFEGGLAAYRVRDNLITCNRECTSRTISQEVPRSDSGSRRRRNILRVHVADRKPCEPWICCRCHRKHLRRACSGVSRWTNRPGVPRA